ncbi:hypothetical protein OC846_000787 [Tilletia horrida]|uniref:Uncharacterized protein n=1 Tax=Tilletia horrida TaxID=155126 RepID=A0AAN6JTK1_9BASI|nr:hypothetical protein OC846_000787 [Tilletia horrida]KAK0567823.1 hypothetical protein OC861_002492 [Tilletia horrida]
MPANPSDSVACPLHINLAAPHLEERLDIMDLKMEEKLNTLDVKMERGLELQEQVLRNSRLEATREMPNQQNQCCLELQEILSQQKRSVELQERGLELQRRNLELQEQSSQRANRQLELQERSIENQREFLRVMIVQAKQAHLDSSLLIASTAFFSSALHCPEAFSVGRFLSRIFAEHSDYFSTDQKKMKLAHVVLPWQTIETYKWQLRYNGLADSWESLSQFLGIS